MKKVIDGSLYNTKTAKKICENVVIESDHFKGVEAKKRKELYKTRSDKFFFYMKIAFRKHVAVNNDDIDPIFEELDLEEEKIVPVSYEIAFQFASEMYSDSSAEHEIGKYFPELANKDNKGNHKNQKKIYLSEKADWYLSMMLHESRDTNSSLIERLIIKEYQEQYSKGIVNRDPYHEMED